MGKIAEGLEAEAGSRTLVLDWDGIFNVVPQTAKTSVPLHKIVKDSGDNLTGIFEAIDQFYFKGHFSRKKGFILPGHWLTEAMSLFALVEGMIRFEVGCDSVALVGLDKYRVRNPVRKGDIVEIRRIGEGKVRPMRNWAVLFTVGDFKACVGEAIVAELTISALVTLAQK